MNEEITAIQEVEEMGIPANLQAEIAKRTAELKEKTVGLKTVFPIVIKGEEYDAKPFYVGYFRQPTLTMFSKYISASTRDSVLAMKALATDCFLDGDKELIQDDSLFMFGLLQQMSKIIEVRHGALVNLSKPGK